MKPSAKGSSLLGCADVDIRVGDSYYIVDLRFLLFLSSHRSVQQLASRVFSDEEFGKSAFYV
jgi:hypothetical protein